MTLSGTVPLYRDRLLAIQTVSSIPGVIEIWDRVRVDGPAVPDALIKAQVKKAIDERLRKLGGFGWGSISAQVKDGVVTLTGSAAPQLAYPAIHAIAEIPGVVNPIDHVRRVHDYHEGWSNAPAAIGNWGP